MDQIPVTIITSEIDLLYFSEMDRSPTNTKIYLYGLADDIKMTKEDSSDIDIFTLEQSFDLKKLVGLVNYTRFSVIFCADSPKKML